MNGGKGKNFLTQAPKTQNRRLIFSPSIPFPPIQANVKLRLIFSPPIPFPPIQANVTRHDQMSRKSRGSIVRKSQQEFDVRWWQKYPISPSLRISIVNSVIYHPTNPECDILNINDVFLAQTHREPPQNSPEESPKHAIFQRPPFRCRTSHHNTAHTDGKVTSRGSPSW